MIRRWGDQVGLIALAIVIVNPLLMGGSYTAGFRVAPEWVGEEFRMALFGCGAGLAFAIMGLIQGSQRPCAGFALVLGIFELAVCGLLHSF